MKDDWKRKRNGWSDIWTHPKLARTVVDTRGFGMNPRISYNGLNFNTVDEAKKFALKEIENEQKN